MHSAIEAACPASDCQLCNQRARSDYKNSVHIYTDASKTSDNKTSTACSRIKHPTRCENYW